MQLYTINLLFYILNYAFYVNYSTMNWLDKLIDNNNKFLNNIDVRQLPIQRQPCEHAIITCMDPRINLKAIGIPTFKQTGQIQSQVRIIRTLGARCDDRSLLVGIHLAGIKEITVLMHTDCGCCLAWHKANTIIDNLKASLSAAKLQNFSEELESLEEHVLRKQLKTFQDPYLAVAEEVESIKGKNYSPCDLIVHGLVYDLETGACNVVINGYI